MASETPATWTERPAMRWPPSSATSAQNVSMASSTPQPLRPSRNYLPRVSAQNAHHLLRCKLLRSASWLEDDAGIAQVLVAIDEIDLADLNEPAAALLDQTVPAPA